MKYLCILYGIFLVLFSCNYGGQVEIPDENLALAIRENLGLGPNDPITGRDLQKLNKLSAAQYEIKGLSGLEIAKNLTTLELYGNQIIDITPLAKLKKLKKLTLSANQITDVTPLTGLKQLTNLAIDQNLIDDLIPIENLSNLRFLNLDKIPPSTDLNVVRKLKNEFGLKTQTPPNSSIINQYDTNTSLPDGAIARLGKGGINVMQFSPNSKYLAVGSDIGVWVYEKSTGKERHLPEKPIGQSNALAFSPNGRILASGGSSNPYITLWDIETGDQLLNISLPISVNSHLMNKKGVTHVKSVAELAFSQDGRTLLSISFSGLINYWNVETGEKISEHHSKFDSEGTLALSQNGSVFGCGYWDGKIWSGDLSTGEREGIHKGHSSSLSKILKSTKYRRIRALTFSTDGELFASGSEDKKVQVWNTQRNRKLATFKGHTSWVTALSFSNDGSILASGDADNIVRLWDVSKKRRLAVFKGHTNGILAMTFTPDGNTLATGSADGTVRLWDVNSLQPVSTFATGHTELVKSVAFSDDSTKVSIAHYNGTVEKWDIKTTKRLNIYNKFPQHLTLSVTLSPDGSHLACHNIKGNISFNSQGWETIIEYLGNDITRIFNLDSQQELPHLTEVYGPVAFSINNRLLAGKDSYNIVPWDTTTDSEAGQHFSLNIGKSKGIVISDVQTGIEFFRIHLAGGSGPLSPGGLLPDTPILFSPGDSILAAGPNVWGVDKWNPITEYGEDKSQIVAYSLDNTTVAIENNTGYERNIHLWDITKASASMKIRTLILPSTIDNRAVALSPNGNILIEATKFYFHTYCEAKISLWDVYAGKKLISLPGHTEHIETLTFSPDGKILASGSEDGTVLLWDWNTILTKATQDN